MEAALNPASDPRLLTVHEAFLLRLARSLVRDAHEAEDVVQEASLAALERQPDPAGGLRGWLARVVSNQARQRVRARGRRLRRETSVARTGSSPPTVDLLAREEQRRRIVAAVLALPATYRDAILLRYLEDLPPRAVARRLEVPVATVRVRLWRARGLLRARLDEQAGGKRGAGLALLAPWVGGTAGLAGGLLATVVSVRIGAVALVLLTAGLLLWRPWSLPERETDEVAFTAWTPDADGAGQPPRLEGATSTGTAPQPTDTAQADGTPVLAPLRGRVQTQGQPVAAARVTVRPARARTAFLEVDEPAAPVLREVQADEHGRFEVPDLPEGPYVLEATLDGFAQARVVGLSGASAPLAVLQLNKAQRGQGSPESGVLDVQVVDMTGKPVPGAEVECVFRTAASASRETSDGDGRARFQHVGFERNDAGGGAPGPQQDVAYGYVTARKDGLVGRQAFNLWRHIASHPVKPIVLAPPGTLTGTLRGGPRPLEGASVLATSLMGKWGMFQQRGTPVTSVTVETPVAADGTYAFDSLPPGTWYLTVRSRDGLWLDVRDPKLGSEGPPPDPQELLRQLPKGLPVPTGPLPPHVHGMSPVKVEITAGHTVVRDLPVVQGATLRGRVRDGRSGRGLAGWRVELEFAPSKSLGRWYQLAGGGTPVEMLARLWPDDLRNPLQWAVATTDADGLYEFRGLAPESTYFVRIPPQRGFSFEQRFVDTPTSGAIAGPVTDLVPAGAARLLLRSQASYTLRHGNATTDAYAFHPPFSQVGVIRVPGLLPGRWTLHGARVGGPGPSPALVAFDVVAGTEVEVNALNVGDCRVSGRVLRGGRPARGARVALPGLPACSVLVADDGRFDLRFASTSVDFSLVLAADPPEPGAAPLLLQLVEHWHGRTDPADDGKGLHFEWDRDVELPDRTLRIRVVDEDGRAVGGAELLLLGIGEYGNDRAQPSYWKGVADAHGRAQVEGLQPGDVIVSSTVSKTGRVQRRRLSLTEPVTEVEVAYTKPASVRVRALDVDGRPVAKANVFALLLEAGVVADDEEAVRHELERELNSAPSDVNGDVLLTDLPLGRLRVNVGSLKLAGRGEIRTEAEREVLLEVVLRPR